MNNKKTYQKPEVSFVDFTLSTSIAGACTHTGTSTDISTCGYISENGYTVFASPPMCTMPAPEDAEFCYHVPQEDNSVFAS